MTGIHALVSPQFFDALIKHKSVKDAYTFYQGTAGTNPMRDDVRRGFRFGSITFEEYYGTVTLANGTTDRALIAFRSASLAAIRSRCRRLVSSMPSTTSRISPAPWTSYSPPGT